MNMMDTPAPAPATRNIKVDALARVEGEGALSVRVKNGKVTDIKFRIFEPPRFFEALLVGRPYSDAPDITSRICGICPIAYLMGASHAMEAALGVDIGEGIARARRMLYCGEWIQSHVLHTAMLHAPDFLGFQDAIQWSKAQPGVVEKALSIKKMGNHLMEAIGGRAVHPVNTKVGGFYKAPDKAAVRGLIEPLKRALDDSLTLLRLFAGFEYPDFEDDYTFVALHHDSEYAIERGRLISNRGLNIPVSQFEEHFREAHVPHSNALHGLQINRTEPYLVGPLARYALNYDQLSELAKQAAVDAGLPRIVRNPFKSLAVRGVETVYAVEEALRLAREYEPFDPPSSVIVPKAGTGHGCTEAPRGICYHRYSLDDNGLITSANIVPPTSQNQPRIEADLLGVVQQNLHLDDEALKWRCEQAIRNYDPCISCATHFLDLNIVRE